MKRTRSTAVKNQFNSECKCINHYIILAKHNETDHKRLYNVKTNNDYDKRAYSTLVKEELISNKATYVCDVCISDAQERTQYPEKPRRSPNSEHLDPDEAEIINLIDRLCDKLQGFKKEQSIFFNAQLINLISFIGENFIGKVLHKEYAHIKDLYKDTAYMCSLTPRTFLNNRNPFLLAFLHAIVPSNKHYSYQFAIVTESIYHLRNNNLILPHSFLANLIQTFISGSKTVTSVNGKIAAGGSETTSKKYLNFNANEISYPAHDSDIYVDNVGKYKTISYRVDHQKNSTPNVVTACIDIPLSHPHSVTEAIQQNSTLLPGIWDQLSSEAEVQSLMECNIQVGRADFRLYRLNYIHQMLAFPLQSIYIEKKVDEEFKRLETPVVRTCANPLCLKEFTCNKRKCDECSSQIRFYTLQHTLQLSLDFIGC